MAENEVLRAITSRRSIRRFSTRDIPRDVLLQLLDAANRAPSGFNLQPWYFVVIDDPAVRKHLLHVAMNQPQALEAPVSVAFVADPQTWKSSYDRVLQMSVQQGALDKNRALRYRTAVKLLFKLGPMGLFGFLKKVTLPFARLRVPVPNAVTSVAEAEHYVSTQTMLAAANFMIAARGFGLDTSPMEGFDESRLKRLLKIPNHMRVPILVSVGYAVEGEEPPMSVRLPLEEKVKLNVFTRGMK